LLKRLMAAGIDAMPYKGPILAHALYDPADLRQFGDLDIIVPPEAMAAVEPLLRDQGYHPYCGDKTAAELQAYMRARAEHTYDFYHP
ncbi:nucleotidyltransferase family protein, partial [Haemophilus parainfluenzae]|uniref:nucleotidyltransferase family protein n=1 Tax=Haemophilus parainfluenzae TaxID=729 RepID=UPI00124B763F